MDTAKAQRARELLPAGRAVTRSQERDQEVDTVVWGTDGRHQNAGDSVAEDETGGSVTWVFKQGQRSGLTPQNLITFTISSPHPALPRCVRCRVSVRKNWE